MEEHIKITAMFCGATLASVRQHFTLLYLDAKHGEA
jgi:hypothetical protein